MQTALLVFLAAATWTRIVATYPLCFSADRLCHRRVFGPPFQPVGVDLAHIRDDGLLSFYHFIVTKIVPAPVRLVGKGEDGHQQIDQLLSTRLPVFLSQFDTAQISVTPFIDNGTGIAVDVAPQLKLINRIKRFYSWINILKYKTIV